MDSRSARPQPDCNASWRHSASRFRIEYRRAKVILDVEGVNVVQFDVGTLRGAAGTVSNPPLGSRMAGRGVRSRPRILFLVRRPCLGDDLPRAPAPTAEPNRRPHCLARLRRTTSTPRRRRRSARWQRRPDVRETPARPAGKGTSQRTRPSAVAPEFTGIVVDTYEASSSEAVWGGGACIRAAESTWSNLPRSESW
jgi:hypothetical protein